MNHPTKKQIAAEQKKGADIAAKLTEVGMKVNVRKDNGQVVESATRSLPWKLGHGDWIVSLDGFSGGFDCARVSLQKKEIN